MPKECCWVNVPKAITHAKKLKIDFVPAMVGFERTPGTMMSHPVVKGVVVLKSDREKLEELAKSTAIKDAKKKAEKRRKEVYSRWHRFIKNILIDKYVKDKYA